MMRGLLLIGLALGCATAHAQDGAPLIDGLGGPVGVGVPHGGRAVLDLRPAFPDGLAYYSDVPDALIYLNWKGSLSFDYIDGRTVRPIPQRFSADGVSFRRIVAFHHSSDLDEFEPGEIDPTITYYANQPPADGAPGRFIATWYRVTHFPDSPPRFPALYNTWQVILTAGPDPSHYAIELRYHRCEWTEGLGRPDTHAAMGFDGGQGPDGPGWMWPGSLTDQVLLLCELSNVREPGVFRYRVVDGIPTGCGIDADPPPGEGRCADGNHLPGDGCSPACYVEPDVDGDGRFEAPSPDSVDPLGVYDDCTDIAEPLCNDDPDGDGTPSITDNCPEISNPGQQDYDGDTVGDACDTDDDFDTLPEQANANHPADVCPLIYSRSTRRPDPAQPTRFQQPDIDGDGLGDACDPDDDGDGILDCGGDGICHPDDDGYNNDFDNATDEGGECAEGTDCHHGDRDFFDNDADGFVDEYTEIDFSFVEWPGRDEPPALPEDNCRRIPNPDQTDTDRDGIGDACDPDIDGDGINNCGGDGICGPLADGRDNDADDMIDESEECALGCEPTADRVDQDRDGWVDEVYEVEQAALDGSIVPAPLDNCPKIDNRDQADWNRDGQGDVCDDEDADGLTDAVDNCRESPNVDQADLDGDGIGDACDDDIDGDGTSNARDSCPRIADDQTDTDGDGINDACDPDDDEDNINDPFDGCPLEFDPDQADLDGDGVGDACDDDTDGDGTPDAADACPRLADGQTDTDRDGIGDACDEDDDGDGIADAIDGCPMTADTEQPDLDGDGIGDACDPSDDRPFAMRTPEERCAILIANDAPTAERLQHCPVPTSDGCTSSPGRSPPGAWGLMLLALGLRRSRQAARRA